MISKTLSPRELHYIKNTISIWSGVIFYFLYRDWSTLAGIWTPASSSSPMRVAQYLLSTSSTATTWSDNINYPEQQPVLHYRVLHPGLVVVGVSLGFHLEVEGAEGCLGEDGVVPDLVIPLESLPELLWTDTKDLLGTFLESIMWFLSIKSIKQDGITSGIKFYPSNSKLLSPTWKQVVQMLSEQSAMLTCSMILHLNSSLFLMHFSQR